MPVTFDKLLGKTLLHSHKDTDLSDLTTLDSRYVNTSGDAMTGALSISASTDPAYLLKLKSTDMDTSKGAFSVNGSTDETYLTIEVDGAIFQNVTALNNYVGLTTLGGSTVYSETYGLQMNVTQNLTASDTLSLGYCLNGSIVTGSDSNAYNYGSVYAISSEAILRGTGTVTNSYGIYAFSGYRRNSAKATNLYGIQVKTGATNTYTSTTTTTAYGIYATHLTGGTSSTTTTYYGIYLADPTGTGTITNNYGLYIPNWTKGSTDYAIYTNSGAVHFGDSVDLSSGKNLTLVAGNIITDTTTGTKIGTATTQKIGVWNTTPIVQPTTAIAASTFAANTSGIANDTATFDGYTLGQVVKALRNIGILA